MPYTVSHTAAVLPFSRWLAPRRLLSAALVGSMVPDLGYLLPQAPPRYVTHSMIGLFVFCLPAGLVCYWIFQKLIKTPFLEILPDGAYARALPCAAPARLTRIVDWLRAAIGVFAGAVTHLAWDGFTHEGARGVRMFPALNDDLADVGGHHLLVYKLLQQGSSAFGLAVVLWVGWRVLRLPPPLPRPARRLGAHEREAWLLGYPLVAALASVAALVLGRRFAGGPTAVVGDFAIAVLRGLAFALLAVPVALRLRLKVARPSGSP
ncbi:MAG: DUF4184 family protein [Gammaproteobacteria bacterium]|nr:DUF4184 family protein [Gammaproteobacteria bacterium]